VEEKKPVDNDNFDREMMARYAAAQRNLLDDGSKADLSRVKSPFWKRLPWRREG
jgi:hypothetical protein